MSSDFCFSFDTSFCLGFKQFCYNGPMRGFLCLYFHLWIVELLNMWLTILFWRVREVILEISLIWSHSLSSCGTLIMWMFRLFHHMSYISYTIFYVCHPVCLLCVSSWWFSLDLFSSLHSLFLAVLICCQGLNFIVFFVCRICIWFFL